jgi:hypothetical protein
MANIFRITATATLIAGLLLQTELAIAQGTSGTTPPTTPPSTAASEPDNAAKNTGAPKKKQPAKKLTRQQEIDKSIDSGTVPARYRRSVPKEYQQYVPFDKR